MNAAGIRSCAAIRRKGHPRTIRKKWRFETSGNNLNQMLQMFERILIGSATSSAFGLWASALGLSESGQGFSPWRFAPAQRAQYPLIKEYSLNHKMKPLIF